MMPRTKVRMPRDALGRWNHTMETELTSRWRTLARSPLPGLTHLFSFVRYQFGLI
jgi:hypothetical protein